MYINSKWEMIGGGSSGGGGGSAAKADNITTISNVDESITAIGIKTKSETIKYDWVGTLEAWEAGRSSGEIPDEWFCYIIDDGTPVVNTSDAKTYATVEYVVTSLNQTIEPIQTELTDYKSTNNAAVGILQSDAVALESRVAAIELAFGETVDQINGEVI